MERKLFGNLLKGPFIDVPAPPMKRRIFYGDSVMAGTNVIPEGTLVPRHSHPEEQISYIISGTCRITTWTDETGKAAGDIPHTVEAGPGDIAWFPSNADHEILMHEECNIMDIFDIVRESWIKEAEEQGL
ncbi:MAG: cupin domain-containing protein [Clostridiales bacterium]|nr:cupin domain-containing protein [Clostridiales bacterium]